MSDASASPAIPPPAPTLGERLRTLNPLFLLFGPTFQREMRVAGRKRSTYAFRSLYLVGLLGIVTLAYIGPRMSMQQGGGVVTVQAFQGIAVAITLVIVWFQFFVLGMMSPSLTGGAISDEKRARTLPALLTTPLSAGEIVLGKLSSRLILLVIVSVLSAPLLLAVRVFGGAPTELVLMALGVCLATGIFAASAALMASNWLTKASSASSLGFGLVLVLNLIPVAVFRLYAYQGWPMTGGVMWLWGLCSPMVMFRLSTEIGAAGTLSGMTPTLGQMWAMNMAVNLGLSLLCAVVAVASFRRSMRSESVIEPVKKLSRKDRRRLAAMEAAAAPKPDPAPVGEEPAGVAPAGEADGPVPASAPAPPPSLDLRDSRVVGDAPVLWREWRQRSVKSRARKWLMIAILGVLALLFYTNISLGDPEAYGFVPMLAVFIVAGQAISLTSSNIPAEREARTWESLLTTPLSGRSIAMGKFLGSLRRVWFVPLIIFVHMGVLGVSHGMVRPIAVAMILMIMVGTIALLAGTGLFFGLHAKKGSSATSLNFLLAGALWMFLPMLAGMVNGLFPFQVPDWIWTVITAINPIVLGVSTGTGGVADYDGTFRQSFDMPGGDWSTIGFMLLVTGFMLAGIALGVAATLVTGGQLRRVRSDK